MFLFYVWDFLPIPGDVFEAKIIDFVFYVSHWDFKYIYIFFTHAFLHISVQLEGESILTAEMLGSILTAEMLVKTISKGNHSICGNAGRKQFQGGSIPTAEMLV